MAGLQRSAISFRRQGSSGLIWDDKLLSGELNQEENKKEQGERSQDHQNQEEEQQPEQGRPPRATGLRPINTIERSRSNGGGRAFRTGRVSPAIDPPSPRVSACGFCSAFGNKDKARRRPNKPGMRRK